MGDIADMMLEGDLCECCGSFIDQEGGSGFPRYCSAACARDRGVMPEKKNRSKIKPIIAPAITGDISQPLSEKLFKRLKHLVIFGTDDGGLTVARGTRMYAGDVWEGAATQYSKLEKRGLVECRTPHNTAHKSRAVITASGIAYLASRGVKI